MFTESINKLVADKKYGRMVKVLATRRGEFSSPMEMKLTGLGVLPEARAELTRMMAKEFTGPVERGYNEIIVGGGPHATIYAAMRVAMGFEPPLVLEACEMPGKTFGCSENPSYFLNSRNRAGSLGLPSDNDRSLNVLPGAPVQLSNLSSEEFQRNSDLAWVSRVSLAMNATVRTNQRVAYIARGNYRTYQVETDQGLVVECDRIIDARGMGTERGADLAEGSDRIMTFSGFMNTMDEPFPLRGMERVAVIGGGDGGKCVIEALTGIGPVAHMSVPSLDFVKQIDWYSETTLPSDCASWRQSERTRYARIGALLNRYNPNTGATIPGRVNVIRQNVTPEPGFECAYVNGTPYDAVILATGYDRNPRLGGIPTQTGEELGYYVQTDSGTFRRKLAEQVYGEEIYSIGPNAKILFEDSESNQPYVSIGANEVALFRLAPRTAQLATTLSA